MSKISAFGGSALVLFSLVLAVPASALVNPPERSLHDLAFRQPALEIANAYQPLDQLAPDLAVALQGELANLAVSPTRAFFDARGGRWGTLILRQPLLPGGGQGNRLGWDRLKVAAPKTDLELKQAAWLALSRYLAARRELAIDPAEVRPRVAVHEGGRILQVHGAREVDGIPVRGSYLTAVINGGNLVLFGTRNWGEVTISTRPELSAAAAAAAVESYLGSTASVAGYRRPAELAIVPLAAGDELSKVAPGRGYDHRLVWVVRPRIAGDRGTWEALVDVWTGELLAFTDLNQYFDRSMTAGVYPVSNDGQVPDGVEQPGFPLPFADAIQPFGTTTFSNANGLVDDVGGILRTSLSGRFVRIADQCGAIDEFIACGDLDLGTGPGTDCDTSATATSAGNTHAARSGFFEVNRIVESARAWLPSVSWLHDQLTANMNIDDTCNAFWDGETINFFKSGDGCANTGEIAAVFDHEWGHGLDDNNADPSISSPGESIADIHAILRLADSCMARGFVPGVTSCAGGGYGDPCLACSGVRDLDFARHQSAEPHDIAWILSSTDVGPNGGCVGVVGTQVGPCGQETHCEGMVPAEAGWDLFARDLQATLDANTALEVATRLFFVGGSNVGSWYQCAPGVPGFPESQLAGCVADGGYLNLLAADDDNGDLADGTPHMAAIFAAFSRHQIACGPPAGPTVQNGGCATGPTQAPAVTVTSLPNGAQLSWSSVPGADRYWIFRTEGVHGCDFGKVRVGETTGTTFVDAGLLDGFEVFYSVMPVGSADACMGPMSACQSTVPTASPLESEAVLAFREVADPLEIQSGDGDVFLDNCETARYRFQVENAGTEKLSDVRIVRVTPVSHPDTAVLTPLPHRIAKSLQGGQCGSADAIAATGFDFVPQGVGFDEPMVFEVEVVGVSKAFGDVSLVGTIQLTGTESDFEFFASRTFSFEEGLPPQPDFQSWVVVDGTYAHASPGAGGTAFHLASSALTAGHCDDIRSPEIRLTGTSALSLSVQFNTEPGTPVLGFYDRANVGIFDVEAGDRFTIEPDGGLRPYNASGPGGVCATSGQPGWAGVEGAGFLPATWSRSALGPAALDGKRLRLDVVYGTDPLLEGRGFQFDEVTLTDVEIQSPDQGSDQCDVGPPPAGDGRVHGSGWLGTGEPHGKLNFSFDARPDGAGGFTGQLQVNDKEVGAKIDARQILTLSAGSSDCHGAAPGPNSFEFTATGAFNGAAGATFRACGADVADPPEDGDQVFVECLAGCGYSTGARTPDDVIDGGNVHVHPPLGGGASGGGSSAVQVLALDPILLTAAPAGTPQLLAALAHDEEGLNLEGRPVTLGWTASDGSTGSETALTDALGVALFWTVVQLGETEYTASTGGLESNGIAVTGTVGLP